MDALTTFVLRHRRLVAACWLVALAAGGFASAILSKHLSQSFEIPGTPSDAADRAIVATYHSGGSEDPLVPVVRLPAGLSARQPAVTAGLRAGFAASSAVGARAGLASLVVSFASTGSEAGPGPGVAVRPVELVASRVGRQDPADVPVAAARPALRPGRHRAGHAR
ncbi:MAG TPA: hypothetical protein VGR98_25055, partial [Streptosporangiaceae bacterium]|nr:hypothetical protein [Streptosporangiaceae bacterium]